VFYEQAVWFIKISEEPEMLLSIHRTTDFTTADCNDIDPGGLALRLAALGAGRIANPIG
jgi:hypothetical protein